MISHHRKRVNRWRDPRTGAQPRLLVRQKKMGDLLKEKSTWEEFFDAHAPVYEDNIFTKNTLPEVDFLVEELSLPAAGSILDVGCGTGRHSIELARRGYSVTGLDLSREMLARAVAAAEAAGVKVNLIRSDAAQFSLLFRLAGVSVVSMEGGTAGSWGRRGLDLDEIEIMIVARKTAEPSNAGDPL